MEVDLSTSDIENAHAFAKRCCEAINSLELMSAMALLRQSKTLTHGLLKPTPGPMDILDTAPEDSLQSQSQSQSQSSPKYLKWTPLHVLHHIRGHQGTEANRFSKAAWDTTRAALQEMSDAEKLALKNLSDLNIMVPSSLFVDRDDHANHAETHIADDGALMPCPVKSSLPHYVAGTISPLSPPDTDQSASADTDNYVFAEFPPPKLIDHIHSSETIKQKADKWSSEVGKLLEPLPYIKHLAKPDT